MFSSSIELYKIIFLLKLSEKRSNIKNNVDYISRMNQNPLIDGQDHNSKSHLFLANSKSHLLMDKDHNFFG